MDIIVCIKRVPLTHEVDLEIHDSKKDIRREALAFVINDWDNYAIEEAVLLKERHGGTVTAITIGSEEDEEVLRRALAMGADRATRIDPLGRTLDSLALSRILAQVIRNEPHDLILTGVQAEDDSAGALGIMVAEHLGIAHAAVVNSIEIEGDHATLRIELEGGMDEVSQIRMPALLTIQTGINEPRYVSIMGIKRAGKKELKVLGVEDLGLMEADLLPWTQVDGLFLPPETTGAKIIEGDPSQVAEEILRILTEKGVSL